MKKIVTVFLLMAIFLGLLSSCNHAAGTTDPSSTGSEATDTDPADETVDTETGDTGDVDATTTDTEGEEETEDAGKEQYDNAVLVSFKTADSDYNGPFNSSVGWKAAGMGYLVRTKSGKVIAIDGGNTADGTAFYNLLKEYSKDNGGVIDYWILTHSHGDHINALVSMVNSGIMDLTVKNLVFDFPLDFNDTTCAPNNQKIQQIASTLGANIITPKKDDKINLDGVEIHFLYTPVNYSTYTSANAISLIFTIETENKKVMITGDAFEPSLKSVADEYKESLKCDILQMPHHFLCDTGYEPFYNYVGAKTLLLPTCRSGYTAMTDSNSEYRYYSKCMLNKKVHDEAETIYKAFDGTVEIAL